MIDDWRFMLLSLPFNLDVNLNEFIDIFNVKHGWMDYGILHVQSPYCSNCFCLLFTKSVFYPAVIMILNYSIFVIV